MVISLDFLNNIQSAVLDEAARVHPNSWWWIKADGCDIVTGLGESVNGEWSGDVNLHEEVLENMLKEYRERQAFLMGTGLGERLDNASLLKDIANIKLRAIDDIHFITGGKGSCICVAENCMVHDFQFVLLYGMDQLHVRKHCTTMNANG